MKMVNCIKSTQQRMRGTLGFKRSSNNESRLETVKIYNRKYALPVLTAQIRWLCFSCVVEVAVLPERQLNLSAGVQILCAKEGRGCVLQPQKLYGGKMDMFQLKER